MPEANDNAAKTFSRLLGAFRSQYGQDRLTNITFWCGAGFSKSWDESYPTGFELFSGTIEPEFDFLPTLCTALGIDSAALSFDQVKELVFALDMYKRHPDLRPRYVDDGLIESTIGELIDWAQSRLEKRVGDLGYWRDGRHHFVLPTHPTSSQKVMVEFFERLFDMSHGGTAWATGLRTHFLTTNYDFVIETVLDAHLDASDTLLLYAYRGFTPIRVRPTPHVGVAHDNWLVFNLLKLNGGLEIRSEGDRFVLDYSRRTNLAWDIERPKLILPSREQQYSDPYFLEVFRKAVRLLHETRILVIVGYSIPEEDALLRFLLRQFSESPEDWGGKCIFYVDQKPQSERLAKVFAHRIKGAGPLVFTFTGPFSDFARDVLELLDGPVGTTPV